MADHVDFDGLLELVPNKATMKVKLTGESTDTRTRNSATVGAAVIEISSFTFGNAKALEAVAKQAKAENKAGGDEDAPPVPEAEIGKGGMKSDDLDENYRFQITKQIEKASPHLMQAFMASSYKMKRKEFNDFTEARIVMRKRMGDAPPRVYLTFKFGKVKVVGYTLETQGTDPPFETVAFSFRSCEIKYQRQKDNGTLDTPIVRSWDFEAEKEKKQ